MIPGELCPAPGTIELNAGRETIALEVLNTGDRPIQVGSHFHVADVNSALRLDRAAAAGFRFDIPAGTSLRFEPGVSQLRHARRARGHADRPRPADRQAKTSIGRDRYAALYGPTVGDPAAARRHRPLARRHRVLATITCWERGRMRMRGRRPACWRWRGPARWRGSATGRWRTSQRRRASCGRRGRFRSGPTAMPGTCRRRAKRRRLRSGLVRLDLHRRRGRRAALRARRPPGSALRAALAVAGLGGLARGTLRGHRLALGSPSGLDDHAARGLSLSGHRLGLSSSAAGHGQPSRTGVSPRTGGGRRPPSARTRVAPSAGRGSARGGRRPPAIARGPR